MTVPDGTGEGSQTHLWVEPGEAQKGEASSVDEEVEEAELERFSEFKLTQGQTRTHIHICVQQPERWRKM